MARALIVGCGCRGRALGAALTEAGWAVRGTTRWAGSLGEIESRGIEGVVADPDRIGTVVEHVEGVTAIFWLMGGALGEPEVIAAIHGPRLERMLEQIVDTPVRAFVYEAAGTVQNVHLERGVEVVEAASERWRIPARIERADPADHAGWLAAMLDAADAITAAA